MPHFKCVACKTRLYSAAAPADLVGDLCPGCGSLLEPVGALAEIVGFRAIKLRDGEARLDAERWADDGGSSRPETGVEAIALPVPEQNP